MIDRSTEGRHNSSERTAGPQMLWCFFGGRQPKLFVTLLTGSGAGQQTQLEVVGIDVFKATY